MTKDEKEPAYIGPAIVGHIQAQGRAKPDCKTVHSFD